MSTDKNCPACSKPACCRYMPAVLIAIVGIGATMAVFFTAYSFEHRLIRHEFDSLSEHRFQGVNSTIADAAKLLQFMDDAFLVGPRVASSEFANYVQSLRSLLEADQAKYPSLRGIIWLPKVSDADRDAYQRAAKAVLAPDFRIQDEKNAGEKRAQRFPVYLCIGKTNLRNQLGKDMSRDPAMWQAMQRACDTGNPVASEPIKLSSDAKGPFGYRLFVPLYTGNVADNMEARRKANAGFLCIETNIGILINTAFKDLPSAGIDLQVNDSANGESVTVCEHTSRLEPNAAQQDDCPCDDLTLAKPSDFFGRKLLMTCRATDAFYARHTVWQPWALLVAGLALTLLAAVQQISRASRDRAIEQVVSTRLAAIQREAEQRHQAQG
jgi:CHASE1-domain containing sensor protein